MPLVDLRVRHLCALLLGCWAANKLPLRLHPEDRDNQEKKETYMSKNLTRKGLALAAIVALGTTLIAGAPAQAANESGVSLAPNAGTTYNSIVGSTFDLSTVVNSNIETGTVTASKLSYLITNSAAAPLKLSFKGSGAASVGLALRSADAADNILAASVDFTDFSAATAKAIVVSGHTTTGQKNEGINSSNLTTNHLYVRTSTDSTDNVVVTVQAFIDENSNGKIDINDFASPVRTLTFIPASKVTASTAITSSTIGSTKLQASVTIGNDINQENIPAGDLFVQFTKDTAAVAFANGASSVDATWDTTDKVIENNYTTTSAAVGQNVYVAQAYFGAALATKLGSASNAVAPVNGTVSGDSTDVLDVTRSANTLAGGEASHTTNTTKVRTGFTGNITFTSKVGYLSTDNTTELTAGAGATVKVTLTKVALAAASTFTAGGKTLTATSGAQSFTVTTDADGKISFTGAGTGAKDDSLAISIAVLKKSGGYSTGTAAGVNTITWTDAAATAFTQTDLIGASDSVVRIAKGATYNVNYSVADQYGQIYTGAKYRASITASAGTAGPAFTYYAETTTGKITQAIVDNSTAAGNYTVTARLYKWNTTTLAWDDVHASFADLTTTVYVNADVAATVTGTAVSSTGATTVATITKTLANADLRVDHVSQSPVTIGYGTGATAKGTYFTISGNVSAASGAYVAGSPVTLTGAGLGFVVYSAASTGAAAQPVYSVGSATVNTNASGAYSVEVYSQTSGKQNVVVTSGAATKSVAIEFSGVTALAETNVVSIDVVSLSQVGRSVTATVKVVDKFGNPVSAVAVAVAVTGVGSLAASTVTTDSKGVATVQFVAGSNDFGDAVITAKYTATDAAATVVSASKTLTVGVTDAQVDIVNNRVTAVSSFTKGRTVSFYVDGVKKWSKLSASDADVVLNYNLKKGTHTVTVKISGGFVTTEKFIVK
jgi:hypothetical protein